MSRLAADKNASSFEYAWLLETMRLDQYEVATMETFPGEEVRKDESARAWWNLTFNGSMISNDVSERDNEVTWYT